MSYLKKHPTGKMKYSQTEIKKIMKNEKYPLSSRYDPDWIIENAMGAHTLWLQESLTREMNLKPDMRVLDLGCGRAISSIFLAKEFGVKVWAADLWNSATDNWSRIRETDVCDSVCPIHADVHDLPFSENYFDALVSINSFYFYVTDGEFLREKIFKYVKPGGKIGVIVPSFFNDYQDGYPEAYQPYVEPYNLNGWRTYNWWKDLFEQSGLVDIILADNIDGNEGNELFQKTACIYNIHETPFHIAGWKDITYSRIIARRKKDTPQQTKQ